MEKPAQPKSREVCIVHGFIQGVDKIPKGLRIQEPYARIALAINTSYPEVEGGYYFDDELVSALCRIFTARGRTEIVHEGKLLSGLDGPSEEWRKRNTSGKESTAAGNEIFEELRVWKSDSLTAQIFGVPWYRTGGPAPYHDTITLEIFTKTEDQDEITASIMKTLDALSCARSEVKGSHRPSASPSLRRGRIGAFAVFGTLFTALALFFANQIRSQSIPPKMLIGKRMDVLFRKDIWIEALSMPKFEGLILKDLTETEACFHDEKETLFRDTDGAGRHSKSIRFIDPKTPCCKLQSISALFFGGVRVWGDGIW